VPESAPNFCVLLGPDHAGKSTAVAELAASGFPCHVVSADDDHLTGEHAFVSRLRHGIIADVGAGLGRAYSADFLVSVAQAVVVHLRDQVRRAGTDRPVLVDSYYYKALAKCRLAVGGEHPLFRWWRAFPSPRRVVYLDVDPETAWQRGAGSGGAHRLECSGSVGRSQFLTYQRDLAKVMREEIGALPVVVVDEQAGPRRTAAVIREVLDAEHR
jgi:thymidylate kinase